MERKKQSCFRFSDSQAKVRQQRWIRGAKILTFPSILLYLLYKISSKKSFGIAALDAEYQTMAPRRRHYSQWQDCQFPLNIIDYPRFTRNYLCLLKRTLFPCCCCCCKNGYHLFLIPMGSALFLGAQKFPNLSSLLMNGSSQAKALAQKLAFSFTRYVLKTVAFKPCVGCRGFL